MHSQHSTVINLWCAGDFVGSLELKDRRRVNDPAISFAIPTRSRCSRLLTNGKVVDERQRLAGSRLRWGGCRI